MKTRICPNCNEIVTHTRDGNCATAHKNKKMCSKCYHESLKERFKGEGNPFFGKTHTKETKEKIASYEHHHVKTEWFRKLRSEQSKGENNPIWGTSNYEIWVKKFGKEKADLLHEQFKSKLSKLMSGSSNPMYGKPTPQGSGNGWSGWYKNWFFRSLRELSYMINVIEAEQRQWRSAETSDLKIKYKDWNGKDRTYTADFLVDEKYLIEVKPKKLQNSKSVRTKQNAAILFCENRGLEYHLIDAVLITEEEMKNLYLTKQIKFTKKYESLFLERYHG